MKKRLAAIAVTLCLAMSLGNPAFAASGFNAGLLRSNDDVLYFSDDMEGWSYYELLFGERYEYFYYPTETWVSYEPRVYSTNTSDCFELHFNLTDYMYEYESKSEYLSSRHFYALPEKIIFKVGNTRYEFYDFDVSMDYDLSAVRTSYIEEFDLVFDSNSYKLIETIAANPSSTVSVRIKGALYDYDFEMSESDVENIVKLYNLYVQAGGTRTQNLETITKSGRATKCNIY